jgi:N-carbamoylputrescine amidase
MAPVTGTVDIPAMPRLPAAIAAVALPSERDLDVVFAAVDWALEEARARGAELVVFPECALGGYLREPDAEEPAGPVLPPALDPDGPEIRRLIEAAGDTVVCMGYTEAGANGPYTSAVCVSGDGVLGHHRKVHLPPAERFAYTAGDGFEAFDTPVGRIGMLLCYDKLFPEAARALALDGAQIICCPAAWPVDRHNPAARVRDDRQTRHFDVVDQARAIENQVFFVASNQVGPWGTVDFLGGAKVVDPDGVVLARTGTEAGLAVARADLSRVGDLRAAIDHLEDRRPETYGPLMSAVGHVRDRRGTRGLRSRRARADARAHRPPRA